jgi:hypothetical protein
MSVKAACVLAALTTGVVVLCYEWVNSHPPAKTHETTSASAGEKGKHHHHKKDKASKTAATSTNTTN